MGRLGGNISLLLQDVVDDGVEAEERDLCLATPALFHAAKVLDGGLKRSASTSVRDE